MAVTSIIPLAALLWWGGQISADDYREILDSAHAIYTGGRIQSVRGDWYSDATTSYAQRIDGRVLVTIDGGIARLPWMTRDGLSLIVCHEVGHGMDRTRGISSETWADRWALTRCAIPFDRDKAIDEADLTLRHLGQTPWDWIGRRVDDMRGVIE